MISPVRFSGFYELYTTLEQFKKLPVGKEHNIPYLPYGNAHLPGILWVYCFPMSEQALNNALNAKNIGYTMTPDQQVMDLYCPEGNRQPIESEEKDRAWMHALLESWCHHRIGRVLMTGLLNRVSDLPPTGE